MISQIKGEKVGHTINIDDQSISNAQQKMKKVKYQDPSVSQTTNLEPIIRNLLRFDAEKQFNAQIPENMNCCRKFRKDGNCFLRALIYGYFCSSKSTKFNECFNRIDKICLTQCKKQSIPNHFQQHYNDELLKGILKKYWDIEIQQSYKNNGLNLRKILQQMLTHNPYLDFIMLLYFRSLSIMELKQQQNSFFQDTDKEELKTFNFQCQGLILDFFNKFMGIEISIYHIKAKKYKLYYYSIPNAQTSLHMLLCDNNYDLLEIKDKFITTICGMCHKTKQDVSEETGLCRSCLNYRKGAYNQSQLPDQRNPAPIKKQETFKRGKCPQCGHNENISQQLGFCQYCIKRSQQMERYINQKQKHNQQLNNNKQLSFKDKKKCPKCSELMTSQYHNNTCSWRLKSKQCVYCKALYIQEQGKISQMCEECEYKYRNKIDVTDIKRKCGSCKEQFEIKKMEVQNKQQIYQCEKCKKQKLQQCIISEHIFKYLRIVKEKMKKVMYSIPSVSCVLDIHEKIEVILFNKSQLNQLKNKLRQNKLNCLRKIRGDGNSFLRALMFGYFCSLKLRKFSECFGRINELSLTQCLKESIPPKFLQFYQDRLLKKFISYFWDRQMQFFYTQCNKNLNQAISRMLTENSYLDFIVMLYFRALSLKAIEHFKDNYQEFFKGTEEYQLKIYNAQTQGITINCCSKYLQIEIFVYEIFNNKFKFYHYEIKENNSQFKIKQDEKSKVPVADQNPSQIKNNKKESQPLKHAQVHLLFMDHHYDYIGKANLQEEEKDKKDQEEFFKEVGSKIVPGKCIECQFKKNINEETNMCKQCQKKHLQRLKLFKNKDKFITTICGMCHKTKQDVSEETGLCRSCLNYQKGAYNQSQLPDKRNPAPIKEQETFKRGKCPQCGHFDNISQQLGFCQSCIKRSQQMEKYMNQKQKHNQQFNNNKQLSFKDKKKCPKCLELMTSQYHNNTCSWRLKSKQCVLCKALYIQEQGKISQMCEECEYKYRNKIDVTDIKRKCGSCKEQFEIKRIEIQNKQQIYQCEKCKKKKQFIKAQQIGYGKIEMHQFIKGKCQQCGITATISKQLLLCQNCIKQAKRKEEYINEYYQLNKKHERQQGRDNKKECDKCKKYDAIKEIDDIKVCNQCYKKVNYCIKCKKPTLKQVNRKPFCQKCYSGQKKCYKCERQAQYQIDLKYFCKVCANKLSKCKVCDNPTLYSDKLCHQCYEKKNKCFKCGQIKKQNCIIDLKIVCIECEKKLQKCVKCKQPTLLGLNSNNVCINCFSNNIQICVKCKNKTVVGAKEVCAECIKTLPKCTSCQKPTLQKDQKGRCIECYQKVKKCVKCDKKSNYQINSVGVCQKCYNSKYKCKNCYQSQWLYLIDSQGRCKNCQYNQPIKCIKCKYLIGTQLFESNKICLHCFNGLQKCQQCKQPKLYKLSKNNKCKECSQNKKCIKCNQPSVYKNKDFGACELCYNTISKCIKCRKQFRYYFIDSKGKCYNCKQRII